MREFYDYDDKSYVRRYDRPRNAATSLLLPLLLIPIAFLAGWITNAYTGTDNLNRILPGAEVGVGGGPEDNNIISPLPTSGPQNPTVSPSPTITPTVTPIEIEVEED